MPTLAELTIPDVTVPRKQPPAMDLTTREQQIVEYVCHGFRNRDIALVLGTSVHTVRNQLSVIYARLGLDSRTELAVRWRAAVPR